MVLKIGIIGAGWFSKLHAEGWRALEGRARVLAVADVVEQAAQKLAASFQANVYTNYQLLLSQEDLDAVDILVPPYLHTEVVCAAARAGVHILCEKPVARDLEEADQIRETLEQTKVLYMPAHNSLFYPTIQRAKLYLDSGNLGQIYFLRSYECYTDVPPSHWGKHDFIVPDTLKGNAWRASKSQLKGGAFLDSGFHAVYRLLHLANARPIAVAAFMGRFHPGLQWESEDTTVMLIHFDNGIIGEVVNSYAFDPPSLEHGNLFLVTGHEGTLSGSEHSLYYRIAGWDEPAVQSLSLLKGAQAKNATIAAEIEHFVRCIEGQEKPLIGFEDAYQVLRVVRSAYRSSERGEIVSL